MLPGVMHFIHHLGYQKDSKASNRSFFSGQGNIGLLLRQWIEWNTVICNFNRELVVS